MSRSRLSKIRAAAGSKGGKATALKGEDFLIERSIKGGQGTIAKYGRDYYRYQLGKQASN